MKRSETPFFTINYERAAACLQRAREDFLQAEKKWLELELRREAIEENRLQRQRGTPLSN